MTKANILVITLNLHNESYFPYKKPSTNLSCVSSCSYLAKSITTDPFKNISPWLSRNYSNIDTFNDFYDTVVKKTGERKLDILALTQHSLPLAIRSQNQVKMNFASLATTATLFLTFIIYTQGEVTRRKFSQTKNMFIGSF